MARTPAAVRRRRCAAASAGCRTSTDVGAALGVEAFITALAVLAFVWLAWVALCLLEQHW